MKKITVVRYKTDCGKLYSTKKIALHHESVCKCWTNPKHKTCKTCEFGNLTTDSDDVTTWKYWECNNDKFDYDTDFNPAHEGITDLCINCKHWEQRR